MHVISRKALRQFWQKYPDSETMLIRWAKLMNLANFQTFDELRSVFPSADRACPFSQLGTKIGSL